MHRINGQRTHGNQALYVLDLDVLNMHYNTAPDIQPICIKCNSIFQAKALPYAVKCQNKEKLCIIYCITKKK